MAAFFRYELPGLLKVDTDITAERKTEFVSQTRRKIRFMAYYRDPAKPGANNQWHGNKTTLGKNDIGSIF